MVRCKGDGRAYVEDQDTNVKKIKYVDYKHKSLTNFLPV